MRTLGALIASLLILTACGKQGEPASAAVENAVKAAAEAERDVASANEAATSESSIEATAVRRLSAFDDSVAVLPKAYLGVDAEEFFSLFDEKLKSAGKDEFETTAEFQRRTANHNAILFPLSIDDKYEFVMGYPM